MKSVLGGLAVATMVFVYAPTPARACGGFFCNSAPARQAAERIVYSLESDGTLVMTVEVDFSGDVGDFAWILPVLEPPTEIGIGSPALFDAIDQETTPQFDRLERTDGTCVRAPRCEPYSYDSGGGCGGESDSSPAADGGLIAYDGARPPVTVHSMAPVGPYDTVVIEGTTAADVVTWLTDNGFDIPDTTTPLLEPYAAEGHVFVALRLSANAATTVLRPVTLRIPTAEACLPIRLTAIASTPTLPIIAFFLAETKVAPYNYATAVIDVRDPSFWTGARSWINSVATEADRLGGHAFAVDYAGATPALDLALPSVLDLETSKNGAELVEALIARGYPGEPVLYELLERFLDVVSGQSYYECVLSGRLCGPESGDLAGLVAAIEEQITVPRREAQAMVDAQPVLTRLYTELDPPEMTVDPLFVPDPRMPDTPNVHVATLVTDCTEGHYQDGAPMYWEISGEIFPASAGTPVGDADAYCRAHGYMGAMGSGCRVTPAHDAWPVLGVLVLLFLRRARQRSRKPSC